MYSSVVVPEINEPASIDPRLSQGPVEVRRCTDIICLILIIGAFAGLGAIIALSMIKDQTDQILSIYDSDLNPCGLNELQGYPYLYFPNPVSTKLNQAICIKKCPDMNFITVLQCKTNSQVSNCGKKCQTEEEFLDTDEFCIFETDLQFKQICKPKLEQLKKLESVGEYYKHIDQDRLTVWIKDLETAQEVILGAYIFVCLMSIGYIFMTRFFSEPFVFTVIMLIFGLQGAMILFCIVIGAQYNKKYKQSGVDVNTNDKTNYDALTTISIILMANTAIMVIFFCCIKSKIQKAINITWTVNQFIQQNPSIILVSILSSLLIGAFWYLWITSAIYIYSYGEMTISTPFASISYQPSQYAMSIFFMFAGLWINAFLLDVSSFIIAYVTSIWYFSLNTGQPPYKPIQIGIINTVRYHLGSIAFGSLLISLVQAINVIFEYFNYLMTQQDNCVILCLAKVCSLCLKTFLGIIRFITSKGYIQVKNLNTNTNITIIQIILTSKSFIPASKEAFETIFQNKERFWAIEGIGQVFVYIGKLFITSAIVFISLMLVTMVDRYSYNLYSPIFVCLIIYFFSFTVCSSFLQLFGMTADTLIMCYYYDIDLDRQISQGIQKQPQAKHCPESLEKFIIFLSK